MGILLNPPFYGRKSSDRLSGLLKVIGDPNLSFLIRSWWLFLLHVSGFQCGFQGSLGCFREAKEVNTILIIIIVIIISKVKEMTISKRYLHPHVHRSIIHKSQDMETPKCPLMNG